MYHKGYNQTEHSSALSLALIPLELAYLGQPFPH